MLVTLTKILESAKKGGYAVIAPDFLSINMLKHYLAVAEKYATPIIASYPPLPIDHFRRFEKWTAKLRVLCESADVPVCLHLDHGKNPQTCLKAIKAGFSSVMIDASVCELEQNLEITRQVVQVAKKAGVSVEAEIGHVGSSKSGIEGPSEKGFLTDPEQAGYFTEKSGIDALAISIGTQHGHYKGIPKIDFQRLEEIQTLVNVPLVLHGGSGTGIENIRRTVEKGILKINVFTDIIKPYLKATVDGVNPLQPECINKSQRTVVEKILIKYFIISGSLGRPIVESDDIYCE